jgi:hypothetical protein
MQKKLSKEEFFAALKRGHGRAFLHVQNFGLAGVADLVLEACLKNAVYDRQCESSRAAWLYSLFADTTEYPRFASAILSAPQEETAEGDTEHFCEMTAQMAINGDGIAAMALRDCVLGQPLTHVDDQYGCRALVLLDGVDAIVELARRFGKLLTDDSDDAWSFLNDFTDGTGLHPSAETTLRKLSETDDAIKAFWSNEKAWALREQRNTPQTKEQGMQEVRERTRRELPLEKILDDAQARVGQYPSRYMRFGRYATEDELRAVLLRLRNESDEEVCLRLLWVFGRASLPDLHPRVWQLAESKNDNVRDAAVTALAQCTDPRVGDFGRAMLRSALSTTTAAEGLEALVKNFQPDDQALIMAVLSHIAPSDEEAHNMGFSISNICRENASSNLSDLLIWDYENNPCTLCRSYTVTRMLGIGALSPRLISECLHDANEEIRQLAQETASR